MRAANLALKFLLELAAFAAFAYWGATTGDGVGSVILAIVAPAVAIVLWAILAAPRSAHRLSATARLPFELAVFGLAAIALVAAGSPVLGVVLAVLAAANAVLLSAFGQWAA